MKGKDLIKLGFKPGPAIGAALLLIPRAREALGHEAMIRELKAVLADPVHNSTHEYFGELARILREEAERPAYAERPEPAPYQIWGEGLEPGALDQMKNAARLPVAVSGALMPDAHQGYGLPIGGVLATENAVIPYAVGVDIACFTGDTRIPLLDGRTYPLRELAAQDLPFPVFACKADGKIVVTTATAHKTGADRPLVKVVLDNGEQVRCTPDHQFMLRDGTYARADALRPGASLMPLYTCSDLEGYARVQQNYSGRWHRVHWLVARSGLLGPVPKFPGQRTVIHHKNFSESDNRPENLEFMGDRDHSTYHRSLVERNVHWHSEEFESRRVAALAAKARTAEGHAYFARRGGANLKKYWHERYDVAKANCAGNGQRGKVYLVAKNQSEKGRARSREIAARVHQCELCGERVKSYIGLYNHKRLEHGLYPQQSKPRNHRVVSVEPLPEREDVYCLSVPGYENFALAAGVFVHNCRMRLSVFDIPAEQMKRMNDQLVRTLHRETLFGTGQQFKKPEQHEVLDEDWGVTPVTKRVFDKARAQLGTSGSGNHFVEFGVLTLAKPDLGIEPGQYLAVLSHSGSRGAGATIADFYSRLAMDLHPELPPELKRLAWLGMDTEAGQEYWAAMNLMGKYAAANHAVIHRKIAKALGAQPIATVENHHNFSWLEEHNGKNVYVHRKGATPAGPGVLGVIPGSMASPGYVVRGKGSAASLESASHGAGRVMSRTAAREKFRWNHIKPMLEERGVQLLSAGVDENPFVYKDIRQVMEAQRDLVEVVARFDPKIVKMAAEGEKAED